MQAEENDSISCEEATGQSIAFTTVASTWDENSVADAWVADRQLIGTVAVRDLLPGTAPVLSKCGSAQPFDANIFPLRLERGRVRACEKKAALRLGPGTLFRTKKQDRADRSPSFGRKAALRFTVNKLVRKFGEELYHRRRDRTEVGRDIKPMKQYC